MNLGFAVNIMKIATIVSMFPKPLKPYVVMSCHESLSWSLSQDCCALDIKHSIANPTSNGIHQTHGRGALCENGGVRGRLGRQTGSPIYFVQCQGYNYAEEQNDMLMWLMSEAKGVERSPERLARRLIEINFASIHTTSLVSYTDLFISH